MRQKVAKLLNFIGTLLMILVILVAIPLVLPRVFGLQLYQVVSESMTPAYSVGSVIYVQECEPEAIVTGDVITFVNGTNTDYVTTHRVVAVNAADRTFTTKGDANNGNDAEPVAFSRLIGKVVFSIPFLGGFSDVLQTTTGIASLVIVFALSFILWILAELLNPKPDNNKVRSSSGTMALRLLGSALIIGGVAYIAFIFLGYRQASSEYSALEDAIFEEGNGSDDADSAEDVISEEEIQAGVLKLQQENQDVVGWIRFDSGLISYPLMQGEDDDYYLDHTYSGEKNSSGSIFLEALSNRNLSDHHTIIYGHNMRDKSMFGQLKNYKDEEFFQENSTFSIFTGEKTFHYQIFAAYEVNVGDELYTIGFDPDEEYQEFLSLMKRRAYYDTGVEVDQNDYVVTLSTCSTTGRRFVVNAVLIQ